MDIARTIVAMVHDRVGDGLAALLRNNALDADLVRGRGPFFINIDPAETLVGQLKDPNRKVPRVSAGFIGDIAVSSVAALVNRLPSISGGNAPLAGGLRLPDVLGQVRNVLKGQLPFLPQQAGASPPNLGGAIENLVGLLDRDPQDLAEAARAFHDRLNGLLTGLARPGDSDDEARVSRLKLILGNDIGTMMPLAAIANAVKGLQDAANVPRSIEEGLLAYLFSAQGYTTVDGDSVIAPVHLADLKAIAAGAVDIGPGVNVNVSAASVRQLKGLFTTATAERYLRDTIRVTVESAYDALRGFGSAEGATGRYGTVRAKLSDLEPAGSDEQKATVDKFATWFRGFSSMAESAVMRAVEVGTQGVSEFQTNPLIAAAAGAFAGTVARKLAQDTFLAVLSAELAAQGSRQG